jgi:AcrR family transcriptional regulator
MAALRLLWFGAMTEAAHRVDGRKLRYAGRRDELLRAVTEYVLAQGVGQLAIRPMAEAVGVSHATLLNHFGTKENLITEVVDLLREQSMPVDPELPIPAEIAEDAAAAIALWWRQWTNPDYLPALRLMFEVYGQALLHPARYERFFDDVVGGWLRFFTRVAEAAGCPADELEQTGTTLFAVMRGLQLDLVATGDTARADAALQLVTDEVARRQALWRAAG